MSVADPGVVLRDLRLARRARRVADVDWIDALYKAYLTGIGAIVAIAVLSGLVKDGHVAHATVVRVLHDGPALLGLLAAVVVAVGLRSGGHGGPLALEAADVRHVLLAPIPRSVALRGAALRQVRHAAFIGAIVGGIAGQLAYRRFPGSVAAWIGSGALFGLVLGPAMLGAAMVLSGRRAPRWLATLLSLLVVGWSVVDVALGVHTSPFTFFGRLPLWALRFDMLSIAPAVLLGALPVLGLLLVGGTSLEAAERRAALVGQLRFAVTLQDLRTVLLLRRQLAQERPRVKPLFRVKGGHRTAVWARDWQGVLRWPPVRIARVLVLGAVVGLSLRGVWSGTTPLVVVAGLALYVIALDAVEALGQELDHPDLGASYPRLAGSIHLAHLPTAIVTTALAGLVGVAAAVAVGPDRVLAVKIGLVVLLPAAAVAVGGAAGSTITSSFENRMDVTLLPPEFVGMTTFARLVWPPAMAVLGVLPVLGARSALHHGRDPVSAAVGAVFGVVFVAVFLVSWVRFREEAKEWWNESLKGMGFGK